MPITPVITTAGLGAVFNATNNGLQARISHIALGDSGWSPTPEATALQNEQRRIEISNGTRIQPNQIHITAIENGDVEYWIREIGFYLDDGTLLAVWSDDEQALAFKAEGVDVLLAFDLLLTALPDDSIEIVGTGGVNLPPATETIIGVVRFATDPEAIGGTLENVAITPEGVRRHGDVRYARANHDHEQYSLFNHNHDSRYSSATHNHDDRYSRTTHNHNGVYSPASHTHAGVYAPVSHAHDDRYSRTTHNHNGVYAPLSHNHDSAYASASHNHDTQYAQASHNHDTRYALNSHNHDTRYSQTTHNHDGRYALMSHSHDGLYAALTHDHGDTYLRRDQLRASYGYVRTLNRTHGDPDAINNWDINYAFITPPSGASLSDLVGFIASIGAIYFYGAVNSDDILYCRYRLEWGDQRIRVIAANSENRADPSGAGSYINYFALWRR